MHFSVFAIWMTRGNLAGSAVCFVGRLGFDRSPVLALP